MDAESPLLLDIWREASRHTRIDESLAAIGAIVFGAAGIDQLLLRRIDLGRCSLETVAVVGRTPHRTWDANRSVCSPEQIKRFSLWCRSGSLLGAEPSDSFGDLVSMLLPGKPGCDVLAGPLYEAQGPVGALVMLGEHLDQYARNTLSLLLEPIAVALGNDRRLREMACLREAAEADRSSLLTRLGRQSLGDTIVGESAGLRPVMERVELVARSDVPVLIFGETGTGKELVARAIHTRSSRAGGPFMRVNCGAIPAELIDSQLFGHERGSFTGATDVHHGWFERADQGTLFLDEIGELPAAAQVRLLRVLQDGIFERVGGQQPIAVNVRIVAATHRDLASMVREGRFREDLWYRLAVFPIDLPPLRQRPEDIPDMARHFAQRAAVRFGLAPIAPSPDDIRLLVSYPWPGNVRELGAVIDRAAILGDGRSLEVATALGVQNSTKPAAGPTPASPTAPPDGKVVSLDEAMRDHILRALRATHGRVEGVHGAARLLKINPHTLRARMRKLRIDWAKFRQSE